MDHLFEILERLYRMPGGRKDPFAESVGPTKECLSSNRKVAFVNGGEIDPDVRRHIKTCEACRESIERFKKAIARG